MDLESLKDDIMREEGHLVLEPYQDSLGFWTIGCGHLIKDDEKDELMTPITEQRARELFVLDLGVSIQDAEIFYEGMPIDDNVKECIIHMSFQLGLPRLSGFAKFKRALINGDIETAMAEMKDSKWYNQTTNRADRLIAKMSKSL